MAVSVIVAGDYCPKDRVIPLLGSGSVLKDVSSIIRDCDLSVVNLECPVIDAFCRPIKKEGVNLSCHEDAIAELSSAGFSVATLANNHILDYDVEALELTIKTCRKYNISTTGADTVHNNAFEPLYYTKGCETIAIINCCEHEFSVLREDRKGANPLDPIRQYYSIQQAKNKADYVLLIIHGGIEMYQLPTSRMKDLYRFFIDAGADAIVNHHQHCYSGYEVYKDKPIFYGLGNFCFDWDMYNNTLWNEGFLVRIIFDKGSLSFDLLPYHQCKQSPKVVMMDGDDKEHFFTTIKCLNDIITDDKRLLDAFSKLMDSTLLNYKSIFEPYSGRFMSALYRRDLLPSSITEKRALKLLDYLGCESHFERVMYFLTKTYQKLQHE